MRFVSFKHHEQVSVGVLHNGSIVDVSAVAPALPRSLKGIILSGIPADLPKRIAAAPAEARTPAEAAELLIPMADPGKVICRSEERRVGKECVRPGRFRWSRDP